MKVSAVVAGLFVDPNVVSDVTYVVHYVTDDGRLSTSLKVDVDTETQTETLINQALRAAIAVDVNLKLGTALTSADVRMMTGMEPFRLVPITFMLDSLVVADDIAQIKNPYGVDVEILKVQAAPRLIALGPATVVVENGGGGTVASVPLSVAGLLVEVAPTISTWLADDVLKFGFSGVGVGLGDVSVTVWIKAPGSY